jgi:tetratricopeptide (TPR) repeat protein
VDQEASRDFFISYTGVNEVWARWIAVELERAGYTTVVKAFDFRPGMDFVREMQRATGSACRTIAVLSPAYFGSRFAESEWRVAFAQDPTGERGILLPVRVQPCEPPGLLATRVFVDLVDLAEAAARERLLTAVRPQGPRPTTAPFPGAVSVGAPPERARFPASGPPVTNLGPRNRNFTGRTEALMRLHDRLLDARGASVIATPSVKVVHGLGGAGKSALISEFAHRFASNYEIIWWISADQPSTTATALAGLAGKLDISAGGDQAATITALLHQLRHQRNWLLIYDNVNHLEDLSGLLPNGGNGHVLISSRRSTWSNEADPLRLDVLNRSESVQYLQHRIESADTTTLAELAALVGDLPLALAEIASYIEQTGTDLVEYRDLLRERAREMFGLVGVDQPGPASAEADGRRVATVWLVSLDQIRTRAPAAEALMTLFAFLAPTIPRTLPSEHPDALPDELKTVVADRVRYNSALRVLGEFSMVTLDPTNISVHPMVQTVVRARLAEPDEQMWVTRTVDLLTSSFPNEDSNTDEWLAERLLPQVLAVTEHAKRLKAYELNAASLLYRAASYQVGRGQYAQALPLAEQALATTIGRVAHHANAILQYNLLGLILHAQGDSDGARTHLERALELCEARPHFDPSSAGTLRSNLATILLEQGELERALELCEARPHFDPSSAGTLRGDLATVLLKQGNLDGARIQFERALQVSEGCLGPNHLNIGTIRGRLGIALQLLGRLVGARTQYERALQICRANLGQDDPDVGYLHGYLGEVLYGLGDLAGARTQLDRALKVCGGAPGSDHIQNATWRSNLGQILLDLGDAAGARAQYECALPIGETALGSDHPAINNWRTNFGRALQNLGDLDGARIQFERALEVSEATLGPDRYEIGIRRNNLGRLLKSQGDLPGARTQYECVLEICEVSLGSDHPSISILRNNLGRLLHDLGDLTSARMQFERALEISEAAHGSDHIEIAIRCNNLGRLLQDLGDLPGARAQLQRALQISETALGPDHPQTRTIRDTLDDLETDGLV